MNVKTSVLEDLRQAQPQLRSQTYFKSSLIALSHAMEDQVLAGDSSPLVIATFQQERFYRLEANRYSRIAQATNQVYVLAAPESDFSNHSGQYETIAFNPDEPLSQEWNLVVLGRNYGTCLVCQEGDIPEGESRWLGQTQLEIDTARRFEGIWSFDRDVSCFVAGQLLKRIVHYRPELAEKIAQARRDYGINDRPPEPQVPITQEGLGMNPGPFAERLITYLQAGQYKLLKAYRSIAAQEEQERLVNSITTAIRQSLDPQEILKVAVGELGKALNVCRCLVYRCKETDATATIVHEYAAPGIQSLVGETWALVDNPLFQEAIERQSGVFLEDTDDPLNTRMESLARLLQQPNAQDWLNQQAQRWKIGAWLMMPILYRGKLLGILELHHCQGCPHHWSDDEVALVNTITIQMGTGLIQAENLRLPRRPQSTTRSPRTDSQ